MTKPFDSTRIEIMVKEFLTERFDIPAEKITNEVPLRSLGLDSIMMLDVMLEIEDHLSIKLRDLSMPSNSKLHDLVELIERNMATSAVS
jgi:acyl carrier protein